jgi:TRAP-type mannitol/chloroaromatic compound transport system permease small subunit
LTPATTDARRQRRSGRVLGLIALLTPPVAWLISLAVSYAIEDFACAAAATADGAAPETAVRTVVLGLNAVLLVVTGLAVAAGVRAARTGSGEEEERVQVFLGTTGAALGTLFAFGIVLIAWNPLVLEVCG